MSTCRRCDLLQSEVWRLAQRQMELDRRLERLERTVDRLASLVQATRRELATLALARRAS